MRDDLVLGFTLSGHCTADGEDEDGRLVCSAVSSAAYMACNTVTDIIGASPVIMTDESFIELTLTDMVEECQPILKGFKLHMTELERQYNTYIKVNSEV